MITAMGNVRRIAFVINRSNKVSREWFRGTMLYTRHNPHWVVRVFEIGDGQEPWLDMGGTLPDGVILYGYPSRAVVQARKRAGLRRIPIMAIGQADYPNIGSVAWDMDAIAEAAIGLFQRRGCQHVAYVGATCVPYLRASRRFAKSFKAVAERKGLGFSAARRKLSRQNGLWLVSGDGLLDWISKLPKPCGILAWDDRIGRNIGDICRLNGINVPGSVYLLGIGDDELICENSVPTLSSIAIDFERSAFLAAKALDDMIDGKFAVMPHLSCGLRGIVERASTQDPKGSGRLVALACDYIAKNACRDGGLNQQQIAAHLGVSVRTLQMRFKESAFARTILQEIQRVQLERVCRLLTTTDQPISSITFASGFGSLSRLKALFQKKFGMSMRDYRILKKSSPPPIIIEL